MNLENKLKEREREIVINRNISMSHFGGAPQYGALFNINRTWTWTLGILHWCRRTKRSEVHSKKGRRMVVMFGDGNGVTVTEGLSTMVAFGGSSSQEEESQHLRLIAFLNANTACPASFYKCRNCPTFHATGTATATCNPVSRLTSTINGYYYPIY